MIPIAVAVFLFVSIPTAFASTSQTPASTSGFSLSMVKVGGTSFSPLYQVVQSENWGGYAVTGATFTKAVGSWTQTTITCDSKLNGPQFSVFWVGIDGFNTNSVEQTGTAGYCNQGSSTPQYFAWTEFCCEQPIIQINNFAVHVGDKFIATINAPSSTKQSVTIKDLTTGQSYTANSPKGYSVSRGSAECIVETPYNGNYFLLAKYATMGWGKDNTGKSGCTANGKSFGSYGSGAYEIQCIGEYNGKVMTQPSALSSDGTSFTAKWKNYGP
jgi:hypothetical protein